jgi:hypothetical protein
MQPLAFLLLSVPFAMSSLCLAAQCGQAMEAPKIVWASDPARPDETVLLTGGCFAQDTAVEVHRLGDEPVTMRHKSSELPVQRWHKLKPLQVSDQSVKFVLPANWTMGAFACRVVSGGAASTAVIINAPDPWWVQGDHGETASPGGWLRVFGKCLSFSKRARQTRAPQSTALLRSQRGAELLLPAKAASCYALTFELPADLASGSYALMVHNGFGGDATWREVGAVTMARPKPWPVAVFNAKELGFAAALKSAEENGGGVIYFPRGRYQMAGQIKLPDRTVLRGESTDLVSIYWADMTQPPDALITGKTFAIEDLTIYCQGYYRNVIEDQAESDGVRLRRLRIRADCFWALGEPGKENRGRIAVESVNITGDAMVLHGRNFQVTDCDILCANRGIGLQTASWGYVARNQVHYGNNGVTIEAGNRIILEDNDIIGSDMMATGNNISTYGRSPAEYVYYARNRLANAYGQDRELMTFDGSGGLYFGAVAAATGKRLVLAHDPLERSYATGGEPRPPAPNSWVGAAVCILDGRGAGQYRRVASHDGRAWNIDRPWTIPPDETSLISIVPFRGHVLFVGNTLTDGGAVQAFGTSLDSIFAENRATRTSGFTPVWGYNGHDWGWQPSWFCQLLDNEILAGNEWGGHASIIATRTSWEEDHGYRGPLARGAIMRRNVIQNNGSINIGGVTCDVIVERCIVRHSDLGIEVEPTASLVVLRNNAFEGVNLPLSGKGLGQALVIPMAKRRAKQHRM